jgi:hypothetical protein
MQVIFPVIANSNSNNHAFKRLRRFRLFRKNRELPRKFLRQPRFIHEAEKGRGFVPHEKPEA